MKVRDACMTEFERDIFRAAAVIMTAGATPEEAVQSAFKIAYEVLKAGEKEIQ